MILFKKYFLYINTYIDGSYEMLSLLLYYLFRDQYYHLINFCNSDKFERQIMIMSYRLVIYF